MEPAVRVRDVVKRVRDGRERRTVLDGISFEVARGELVVLRGPSGSGKTTLLAVVGAMLSPTSGEVFLDGEPTSRLRDVHRAETRRRKVGFVFQDLQLVEEMRVRDNVLLPRVPDGVTDADERRADALLARFGVAQLAQTKARALSGGERQRVALARALLCDPPLLLLDEPTAHLDDLNARAVVRELAELVSPRAAPPESMRPDADANAGADARRIGSTLERSIEVSLPRAVLVATHDERITLSARVLDLVGGRLIIPAG